uniref:Uncharacterized protein n=1 Tax=Anguilla anguilla TaxID=7936 RepID=A0A0E9SPA0_ANGAN
MLPGICVHTHTHTFTSPAFSSFVFKTRNSFSAVGFVTPCFCLPQYSFDR